MSIQVSRCWEAFICITCPFLFYNTIWKCYDFQLQERVTKSGFKYRQSDPRTASSTYSKTMVERPKMARRLWRCCNWPGKELWGPALRNWQWRGEGSTGCEWQVRMGHRSRHRIEWMSWRMKGATGECLGDEPRWLGQRGCYHLTRKMQKLVYTCWFWNALLGVNTRRTTGGLNEVQNPGMYVWAICTKLDLNFLFCETKMFF